MDEQEYLRMWYRSVEGLTQLQLVHPLLRGFANRLLFDKGILAEDKAATQLEFALSGGQKTNRKARWLEGFLSGSGLLLIYNPQLWQLIDKWVEQLTYTEFRSTLPCFEGHLPPFRIQNANK